MAGKRYQSIVQVTFIRVLMVTSRLAWCSQEEGRGRRESECSIRIDRSFNRGSSHVGIPFSSMNALIIIPDLRRFPLAKTFGLPWLIRPPPDYPARKTWPKVSLRRMSHAVNFDSCSVIRVAPRKLILNDDETISQVTTYLCAWKLIRKLSFQTITHYMKFHDRSAPFWHHNTANKTREVHYSVKLANAVRLWSFPSMYILKRLRYYFISI